MGPQIAWIHHCIGGFWMCFLRLKGLLNDDWRQSGDCNSIKYIGTPLISKLSEQILFVHEFIHEWHVCRQKLELILAHGEMTRGLSHDIMRSVMVEVSAACAARSLVLYTVYPSNGIFIRENHGQSHKTWDFGVVSLSLSYTYNIIYIYNNKNNNSNDNNNNNANNNNICIYIYIYIFIYYIYIIFTDVYQRT